MFAGIILLIAIVIFDWGQPYMAYELLVVGLSEVALYVAAMKIINLEDDDEES